MLKALFLSVLLVACFFKAYASVPDSISIEEIKQYEDSILQNLNLQSQETDSDIKLELNKKVVIYFRKALSYKQSVEYSFDTLKTVGRISSDDNAVKIFTWNVPLEMGTHKYFGFIQQYNKKTDELKLFELVDSEKYFNDIEKQKFYPNNWYGCIYYEIIQEKIDSETYYHLLGFDFNDILTSKKIIDVLHFNQFGDPEFGAPIFNYNKKLQNRVVFEFSARVAMVLQYNKRLKMITFDHLSPFKPSMRGNYQFYGPDLSYDGLKFEKGIWQHYSNVDARNEY